MKRLFNGCYSYSIGKEDYKEFHFYDTGLNGATMGMEGTFSADYWKYDGRDKCIESGHYDDLVYDGIKLSPIQFYRMAEQVFAFCNSEFGTHYPKKYIWHAAPCFVDEQTDYNKSSFPKYIDREFKLVFKKLTNYDFSNGAKDWREARVYHTYKMHHDVFGGRTWGEHTKSFYIALADGFWKYLKEHNSQLLS